MAPIDSLVTVLFTFHSNYGSMLYYFQHKWRYWSKMGIFPTLLQSTSARFSFIPRVLTSWKGDSVEISL